LKFIQILSDLWFRGEKKIVNSLHFFSHSISIGFHSNCCTCIAQICANFSLKLTLAFTKIEFFLLIKKRRKRIEMKIYNNKGKKKFMLWVTSKSVSFNGKKKFFFLIRGFFYGDFSTCRILRTEVFWNVFPLWISNPTRAFLSEKKKINKHKRILWERVRWQYSNVVGEWNFYIWNWVRDDLQFSFI
jgi:hypothetical protein